MNFSFDQNQWINLSQAATRSGLSQKKIRVRVKRGEILAQQLPMFSGKTQILVRWRDVQDLISTDLADIVRSKWPYLVHSFQKVCNNIYNDPDTNWRQYFASPKKGRKPVLTTWDDFFDWEPRYEFWLLSLDKIKHDLTKNFLKRIENALEIAKQKASKYLEENFDKMDHEDIDPERLFLETIDNFLYNKKFVQKIPKQVEERGKSRKEFSSGVIEVFSDMEQETLPYNKILIEEALSILDFRERSIFEDKEIERLTGKEIVQKYKDDPDMNINTENKVSRIYQSALQKLKEKFDC
jgi:hypothetical protein